MAGTMAVAAALEFIAYRPGIIVWDSIRQYGQALSGHYDDWHPPAMEWLWRQLLVVAHGPLPMLLLQMALYWAGYALLAGAALRERRPWTAAALAACALLPLPFALMGTILKDCLMAGALLGAAGLLAWRDRGRWVTALAMLLLVYAATIRFNAFLAALPIAVALLPPAWRRTWPRFATTTLAASAVLVAALPAANRMLHANRTRVELSLVMFDLGGISHESQEYMFPPLPIRFKGDPVDVNDECYDAEYWDTYAWWTIEPCPISFFKMRDWVLRGGSPYRWWLRAVLAHPLAYAKHRLAHFNINSRFLVREQFERPVSDISDPNPWNFQVPPSRLRVWIDRAARQSTRLPIGWPIWWIAAAAGTALLAPVLPSRRLALPLALSSLLYGLGYLPLSVASEMRYHLWTMMAAAVAAVLVAGDLLGGERVSRWRLALALAPMLLVAVIGAGWRAGIG